MNFLIYFLLFSGVSIITSDANCARNVLNDIQRYFASNEKDLGIQSKVQLRLISGKMLAQTGTSVVWQGVYGDDIPVAVKIVWNAEELEREAKVLAVLNANEHHDIDRLGIPRIYYAGPILKYNAIAMTLFDGTLEDYYQRHKSSGSSGSPEKLPDSNILEIFRQTVKILKYLNQKDVLHNDIKPENIFFRVINDNTRFYISDFNLATTNGEQNDCGTLKFASANFYNFIFRPSCRECRRYAMDDLESLSYSMWYVSGIPLGKWTWLFGLGIPEGCLLSRYGYKMKAANRVQDKLSILENRAVREVFKFICVDEMLSGRPLPNYDRIIAELHQAIVTVANNRV